MRHHGTSEGMTGARMARPGAWLALSAAVLLVAAGPARAHGGDTAKIHACILPANGGVKIVGPDEACPTNSVPLDWSSTDTNTTYSAGTGLSLSSTNVFSVSGVPWTALTDIPPGFADGVDDVGSTVDMKSDETSGPKEPNDGDGFVHWNHLEGVPSDIADGDDEGAATINALKGDLARDDGTPNERDDLVSFSQIKDLIRAGEGQITADFVRDGSIEGRDIRDRTLTAGDLAGSDAPGDIVLGAVTSEKIMDRTIQARDLAPGVMDRLVETVQVDPAEVQAGERTVVTVAARVARDDLVTVSPPHALEPGLVFAGSAVRDDGALTIYLYNASPGPMDGDSHLWTVNRIRVP